MFMSTLRVLVLSVLIAVAPLAGCGKKFSDDSKVLATVNGESITEKDFENYMQLRMTQQGPVPDTEKGRKLVLDEMIDRVLLVQRGVELGYDQNPEVHFRLKRMRENLVAQEVVRNTLKDVQFSDEDVKKRLAEDYEKAHKTEYKVSHILVKTEDEAKAVTQDLKGGKKFEQIAKEKSTDTESAKRGGDLGDWISQGSGLVPEFFNALPTLKKGQVSEPVKTDFGWHIIRVDNTRPLKLPSFEQIAADPRATQTTRRRMQEEKLQVTLKELKDKASISVK
jgi:peptidyl-prolyl cis-trans isomerase C